MLIKTAYDKNKKHRDIWWLYIFIFLPPPPPLLLSLWQPIEPFILKS